MKRQKRTDTSQSLNPFNEGVVKLISASVTFNKGGRSVLVRTFQTSDGKQHTAKLNIDSDTALNAVKAAFGSLEVGFLLDSSFKE
jgi:hypothetical protein